MEFKGTSGIWYIDTELEYINRHDVKVRVISSDNDENMIEIFGNEEQDFANAQLIATAPKLLEALQQAIEMCDKIQFPTEQELKDFVKLWKQVINQATKID